MAGQEEVNYEEDILGQQPEGEESLDGKIFIGGLSWQTTEDGLRFYFGKFGEVSDVNLMIDKKTGQPRGFAFVTMKDPLAVDVILSQTHNVDNRMVDVKRAVARDQAPAPSRMESRKIFVGGLHLDVTEKEFKEHFSKYGIVQDVVIMIDRKSNRSRGFGFVTFESEDTVNLVMKNDHEIMGKWVEIKRAEPRDMSYRDGGHHDYHPRGGFHDSRGGSGRGGNGGGRGRYADRGGRGGYSGRGGGRGPSDHHGGHSGDMGYDYGYMPYYGMPMGMMPPRGYGGYPAMGYPQDGGVADYNGASATPTVPIAGRGPPAGNMGFVPAYGYGYYGTPYTYGAPGGVVYPEGNEPYASSPVKTDNRMPPRGGGNAYGGAAMASYGGGYSSQSSQHGGRDGSRGGGHSRHDRTYRPY